MSSLSSPKKPSEDKSSEENEFLTAPIGRLFLVNAVPMALIMAMSGLLNVVDAAFLGHYVGASALAAVSISFPFVMFLIALATLAGGGMASLFARRLGAGERTAAAAVFASAHGLCLTIGIGVIVVFMLFGAPLLARLSDGNEEVATLARTYLVILVWGAPLQFLMSLHADAARSEGRAKFMALLSAGVTLANIVLNYVLIVVLDMGVAGSALGTVAAQVLGLVLLLELRRRDFRLVPLSVLGRFAWHGDWRTILALGLPLCLSFMGTALVSGVVIVAARWSTGPDYTDIAAAYGVVTRIFGLAFMPLMALALATQTIVGTNTGGGLHGRAHSALLFALGVALGYCLVLEMGLLAASAELGAGFVADAGVGTQVGFILRRMLVLYVATGPILVLAMYFQAVGRPERTAALMLLKPFVLAPALIFAFAALAGPDSLWWAFPVADGVIVLVGAFLFVRHLRTNARLDVSDKESRVRA